MMELSIDRAGDGAGLEAGVRLAKGHRGGHGGSQPVNELMIARRWVGRRAHGGSFLPSVLMVIILLLVKPRAISAISQSCQALPLGRRDIDRTHFGFFDSTLRHALTIATLVFFLVNQSGMRIAARLGRESQG